MLNVVSSKVTLEEKATALDNFLARVASDHVVDMGTNTTPLDQPVLNIIANPNGITENSQNYEEISMGLKAETPGEEPARVADRSENASKD